MRRITGYPADPGEMIELQAAANPPGDKVVGARGVAADAEAADLYPSAGL
jgi:hypothetical protein